MEGENRHATVGVKASGQVAQKQVKHAEFVIYGDAQGLEDAAHTIVVSRLVMARFSLQ
jgi:hypothetical protein